MTPVPDGFVVSPRTGPFLDLLGPVYVRDTAGGLVVGLRVEDKHLNARGRVHGAVVCALADVALGRNLTLAAGDDVSPVTASLQVHFLGSATGGDWVEATAVVNRAGRRMGFVDGSVRAAGQLIATATALFAMGSTG